MSQERIDALLRAYTALNNGDLEAACGGLQQDFEFIPPPMLPETEVDNGPEGLRRFWQRWSATFDNFHVEIEETIDAGDRVIVMAAVAGTAPGLGTEVRTPSFAWVWSFEGDTPIRMEAMPNRATALEAVGLTE
ncbi:MAG: nuclear transport factor 2 family protein [Solirubrobacterales bacterium]